KSRQRQAQGESATAPVGGVDEGIEVAPHPIRGICLQVAPFVVIHEARSGDLGARGDRTQLRHLGASKRSVDGREFVVLVLTHEAVLRLRADGDCFTARNAELSPRWMWM